MNVTQNIHEEAKMRKAGISIANEISLRTNGICCPFMGNLTSQVFTFSFEKILISSLFLGVPSCTPSCSQLRRKTRILSEAMLLSDVKDIPSDITRALSLCAIDT